MDEFDRIAPHKGAQERFLSNSADICIYGGSAGSGKSIGLLMDPLRHINVPNYGAVIFRREAKELTMEGGLISKALQLYPRVGGVYRAQPSPNFTFSQVSKISFGHLNQENEVLAWKGSEICGLYFDEIDGFSEFQIDYMLSRNRSTCGVRPYLRGTCNPDADSWLAGFLAWWIDQDTGYPIHERSGKIRYMIRVNGERFWADSREELVRLHGCEYKDPKSVSFVPARITDNPTLLSKDPGYLANLKGLPRVERAKLLDGNWKVRPASGLYFPSDDLPEFLETRPTNVVKWVRSWDLAATEETDGRDPDWTVGCLIGRLPDGDIVVDDVIRVRRKASVIRALVANVAARDGRGVWIALQQDPGQSGKEQIESYRLFLRGFTLVTRPINKNKITVAASGADSPAALWQRGKVHLVKGGWNKAFMSELDAFPRVGIHDDQVDSFSSGVRVLPGHAKPDFSKSGLSGRFREQHGRKNQRRA